MAHRVTSCDVNQSFASGLSLLALMRGELELAAEPNASRLRSLTTFISSCADQLPFKFGEATKHRMMGICCMLGIASAMVTTPVVVVRGCWRHCIALAASLFSKSILSRRNRN